MASAKIPKTKKSLVEIPGPMHRLIKKYKELREDEGIDLTIKEAILELIDLGLSTINFKRSNSENCSK
jgi:hypothetical protein